MSDYTVLLYHGVHRDDLELGLCNSSGKHIAQERFTEQMRWLSENRLLIPMDTLEQAYRGIGSVPDGAVAINFDDGFLNNYEVAWPVLEKYRVPATIYLATGFIGSGRMVWSDRLESGILNCDRDGLSIEFDGETRDWPLSTDTERQTAFSEIKAICKSIANDAKEIIVAEIQRKTNAKSEPDHPLYAFMNWHQVREMNASPLISFGGHTIDHVSLGKVSNDEMRRQIDVSMETISRELREKCRHFSYPEGQAADYNAGVIKHLQDRDIALSPSAIDGQNMFPETDPFHIKCIMVGFENRSFPFDLQEGSQI